MQLRPLGTLLGLSLLVLGGLLVALALVAVPLGLGGDGFGYKKLLLLCVGLECCGCGALLRQRLRGIS